MSGMDIGANVAEIVREAQILVVMEKCLRVEHNASSLQGNL